MNSARAFFKQDRSLLAQIITVCVLTTTKMSRRFLRGARTDGCCGSRAF